MPCPFSLHFHKNNNLVAPPLFKLSLLFFSLFSPSTSGDPSQKNPFLQDFVFFYDHFWGSKIWQILHLHVGVAYHLWDNFQNWFICNLQAITWILVNPIHSSSICIYPILWARQLFLTLNQAEVRLIRWRSLIVWWYREFVPIGKTFEPNTNFNIYIPFGLAKFRI